MNKAIFLDRDGTIIEDNGYICCLQKSYIFPFSFEAIRIMNELSFIVIGITNQSSIARGICTESQVEEIHSELKNIFLKFSARIEKFYYSPYHPNGIIEPYNQNHFWRKPSPGMLQQAAIDYELDMSKCFMIGDDICDIQAGKQAGCKTVLVLTGKGQEAANKIKQENIFPNFISQNILTAIHTINKIPGQI